MAVSTLEEQSIYFIAANGQYNESAIFGNNLIQTFAANCAGGFLFYRYETAQQWNGTTFIFNSVLRLFGYVTPAFQATVQSNIAALQAAFPQYTIGTEGPQVAFGS